MIATIKISAKTPHRAQLVGVSEVVTQAVDKATSFAIEGAVFIRWKMRLRGWDGRRHLFSKLTGGFPSGLLGVVKQVLLDNGIQHEIQDERRFKKYLPVEPDYFKDITLAKHQLDAINGFLKAKGGILHLATNCLSGNTLIPVNRGGKSFKIKLKDLHHRFNGGAITWGYGTADPVFWDPSIPTKARSRFKDSTLRLVPIKRVFESGLKVTYLLKTENGRFIRATEDHRFLTSEGWVRLKHLRVGNTIYVDGGQTSAGPKKRRYLAYGGMEHHPFASIHRDNRPGKKPNYTVQAHRLVMEAKLNRMDFDVYLSCVQIGRIKGLHFIDPSTHTAHHIDGDTKNNDSTNIELKDRIEHLKEHAKVNWRNVSAKTVLDRITFIGKPRMQKTYDIEMEKAPRNFLANGFVVHNSGKTECGAAIVKRTGLRTLWIVPGRLLLNQTRERLARRLGVKLSKIGAIGSGKFDIQQVTVAIANSLAVRKGKMDYAVFKAKQLRLKQYLGTVELVVCDEVHHSGSETYWKALSNCKALWRCGLSGTPLDRTDGKNLLVEALCGPVVSRVTNDDLIKLNWSAKPVIEMYEIHSPKLINMSWQDAYRLGVVENEQRNERIIERAIRAANNKVPVLILCRQIEHIDNLKAGFEVRGVRVSIAHAKRSIEKVKQAIDLFVSGKRNILIGSPMFGEGLDFPGDRINVYINAEALKSTILLLQKLGRSMRKKKLGKNEVTVVEFADFQNRYLAEHSLQRLELYEREGFVIRRGTF